MGLSIVLHRTRGSSINIFMVIGILQRVDFLHISFARGLLLKVLVNQEISKVCIHTTETVDKYKNVLKEKYYLKICKLCFEMD